MTQESSSAVVKSFTQRRRKDPLKELVPLTTPLVVQVEPTNACNFRCTFCPTGNDDLLKQVGRKPTLMSFDLYRKIIDDFHAFPDKVRVLTLYKDGEPLINKSIVAMVEYAKQRDVAQFVEITSNGALLDEKMADGLMSAGLDVMRISVYGVSDDGYRKATKTFGDLDVIKRNVAYFYKEKTRRNLPVHIHCKILDSGLTADERSRFVELFSGICDSVHVDSVMGWTLTGERDLTLGLNPETGISGAPLKPARQVCPEPFMKLAVNANGTISVCCVDWSHAGIVGDARHESLVDVWNGDELRSIRVKMLQGRRDSIKVCNGCQYVFGFEEISDLDADIPRLLSHYSEA